MSENKNVSKAASTGEALVDYTAPVDPAGEHGDLIVAVNGECIRIKRGETVKIKKKFLEVLELAQSQNQAAWQMMRSAQRRSE